MDARELRIGNYYDKFGHAQLVSWTTLKDLSNAPKDQLWCKPIPLTEEWLTRFGFVITRTQAFKKYNEFGDQVSLNKIGNTFELVYLAVNIQYVHQLQNLYFALTGAELELKDAPI